VHDFEGASDNDIPAGSQSAPASSPADLSQPSGQAPAVQPGPGGQKAAPPADRNQPDRKRHAANPGTSRSKTSNQAAAWSPPIAPAEASATRFTHAQKGAWHELRKPSRP
jgi:hypothetical protein